MGLQIGLPWLSRRAFWARLYARRRLLSERAAPFAPTHYALIGESLGYRPNAFFDPNHFRRRANIAKDANRGLLELYLARPSRIHPPLPPNSTTAGTRRKTRIGRRAIPIRSCTFSNTGCALAGARGQISMLNSSATSLEG